ncbi:NACHT domain-containing protein [Rubinisphaera sp.]|uniref:TIR domain-containing protein n=1 Tax=Rubinisphaera sp. TaxID=2024857 RepID=UPI000C0F3C81|nr:NACHT domain-containing protein [Rubinisphaera sp.]MBV09903.1 hypothetical protein [Rubinisphaera sp.]|tara:strand:- start:4178 stop:8665 length:4488 start_codon:yes stop_codon:yes gene_type:complete
MKLIAFFSYSHLDDENTNGFLFKLHKRIKKEIGLVSGNSDISVFFDKDGIEFGQFWERKLEHAIEESVALIPVISPTYMKSEECKKEFRKFLIVENSLRSKLPDSSDGLIFPIILNSHWEDDTDSQICEEIKSRQCFSLENYNPDGHCLRRNVVGVNLKNLAARLMDLWDLLNLAPSSAADNTDSILKSFETISKLLLSHSVVNEEWIERPEEFELLGFLDNTSESTEAGNTNTVCLLGSPGSGKTALLAKVAKLATVRGFATIGLKADYLPNSDQSIIDWIDQQLVQSSMTAVDAIRRLATNQPVLVLLDQLDAMAGMVDLTSNRLNEVIEFLLRVAALSNVKVICSCREYEYERDVRFRQLSATPIYLKLPGWDQVSEKLDRHGITNSAEWTVAFREILQTPQHLTIFLEQFERTGKAKEYPSYHAMLNQLWEDSVTTLEEKDLLFQIARYSIERETTTIPRAQLDRNNDTIDMLVGKGIITKEDGKIGFRHQTLLEHAKARLFLREDYPLCQHVIARQQALFVRPTIWSVLQYHRIVDDQLYLKELNDLFASDARLHVRYLLIEFLGQVENPTQEEILIMADRLRHDLDRSRVLIATRGSKEWFVAFRSTHFPSVMQWTEGNSWLMVGVIKQAWEFARDDCLKLLLTHWVSDPEKSEYIYYAINDIDHWDNEAVQVISSTINHCENIDRIWWVEGVVYDILKELPEIAPSIFVEAIQKQLELMELDPEPESIHRYKEMPKSRDPLEWGNHWYSISDVAKASPVEFLRAVWPWFLTIADRHQRYGMSTVLHRYLGSAFYDLAETIHHNPIQAAIIHSVTLCAEQAPLDFIDIVQTGYDSESLCVHQMIALGFTTAPYSLSQYAIEYICNDRRRLFLGTVRNNFEHSNKLLNSLSTYTSDEQFARIINVILEFSQYRREVELCDSQLILDREARMRLLHSLPFERLPIEVQQLYQSETAELPKWDYEVISNRRSGQVRHIPPFSSEQLLSMPEDEIINALSIPEDEDGLGEWVEEKKEYHVKGGSISVARQLSQIAESNHAYVLELLPSILNENKEAEVAEILEGLSKSSISTTESIEFIRSLMYREIHTDFLRARLGELLRRKAEYPLGLPNDICEQLLDWLNYHWDYNDEVLRENRTDGVPESILWRSSYAAYSSHSPYCLMMALLKGCILRTTSDYDRCFQSVFQVMDFQISNPAWINFINELMTLQVPKNHNDLKVEFITLMVAKNPHFIWQPAFQQLVAKWQEALPESFLEQFVITLGSSQESKNQQAYGELLTFLKLTTEKHSWAHTLFEHILLQVKNDVNALESIAVGITFTACRMWERPKLQPHCSEILAEIIPVATPDVGTAVGTLFWYSDNFAADNSIQNVLNAMTKNPEILLGGFIPELIDAFVDLVPHMRFEILKVCELIVEHRVNDIRIIASEAYMCGPKLVSISLTLQRFDDTREQALRLFETLLQAGIDDAYNALNEIDLRPIGIKPKVEIKRRRRNIK